MLMGWIKQIYDHLSGAREREAFERLIDEVKKGLEEKLAGLGPPDEENRIPERVLKEIKDEESANERITSWRAWRHFVRCELKPVYGWSAARFANRLGPTDRIGWVYGVVRGNFGVWCQPFHCCAEHGYGEEDAMLILAAVTHLPTGMGIGVFKDADTACTAAHLIDDADNWRDLPHMDEGNDDAQARAVWSAMMEKAFAKWRFNGIDKSSTLHAHNGPDGHVIEVWMAGKTGFQFPEREKMQ